MSKVFVIPDVHLKPWMFDKAEDEYDKNSVSIVIVRQPCAKQRSADIPGTINISSKICY